MSTQSPHTKLRIRLKLVLAAFLFAILNTQGALANDFYSNNDIEFYDKDAQAICGSPDTAVSGSTVVRFLQALADQESGGDPTAEARGSSASGKYQYLDSTWQSSAGTYYPPGKQYARAKQAPEAVQDAVAYLEYAHKFRDLSNSIFKLAVSHFYPAANSNDELLDKYIPPNTITPRQYANSVIQKINSGAGRDIPMLAAQAPDFAKYLDGLSPPSTTGGNTTAGTDLCNSTGIVNGDIAQTALALAWDTVGHGRDRPDAKPAYQKAMPLYNGSTGQYPYSDCGVFVATVMRATGADKGYPKRVTSIQIEYLRSSGKYNIYEDINDTSKLVPGDILIFSASPFGHTYIFTGGDGKTYNAASASLSEHVPQAENAYLTQDGNHFTVARLK